jgi:Flp pilus assembly protein TadD
MKFVFGRLGVLLMVCTMSCGRYVAKHVESGDSYFKEQKYQDAVSEYVKAARFDADNEHIVRQLGLSYYKLQRLQDAFDYLSKAELSKPSDWEVRVAVGQLYLMDHKLDQALREAQAVLASQQNDVPALQLLASVYLNQKDFAEAIETHRHLIELSPNDADRHADLGVALMAGQRLPDARKEFETALSLAPDNVQAGTQIVNLDLLAGRPDDALAHIQKQIATAGRKPKLLLVLAPVQAARGDMAGAEKTFQEAARLDAGHAEARLALADFYVRTGRVDQATPVADSAIAVEKTAQGYQLRGIIFQMKGSTKAAKQSYEQALALNPGYAQAANNLAWLLSEKLGDNRNAYNAAVTAYRAAPEDSHIQDTFGWILYRVGDIKNAVNLLKSSAQGLPTSPGVQYHLGMALLSQGDTAEARRALTKAVGSPMAFDDRAAAQKRLESLR